MKKLELLPDARPLKEQGAVYTVSHSALSSYAHACLHSASIISNLNPDLIFCPLRGAYPPTRVIQEILGEDYEGAVEWVPASGFLKRRVELFESAAVNYGRSRSIDEGPGHVLSIDTAITGSSSRNQRRMVKKIVPRVMAMLKTPKGATLDFTLVRIWHGREGEFSPESSTDYVSDSRQGYHIRFRDFNIGVEDLVCEDKPNLLGIDYPNRVSGGFYSPYLAQVMAKNPIRIRYEDGSDEKITVPENETTADLFVKLVLEEARKIQAKNPLRK